MGDLTRFATVPKKWRFTINNETESLELNSNPIGWDDLRLSLTRNENNKSLIRGYSANLEYIFEGADKLMEWENANGILAESELVVDKVDTSTGKYDNVLTAKHDYVEYKELTANKKGVSIPLIDSSFNEKIKNREDVDIAVDSNTNLDGNPITPIQYKDITLKGREFGDTGIVSNLYDADLDNQYESASGLNTGGTEFVLRILTENVDLRPNYQNVYARQENSGLTPKSTDCFYYNEVGTSSINLNLNLLYSFSTPADVVLSSTILIGLGIVKFKTDGTVDSQTILESYEQTNESGRITINNGVFSYDDNVELNEREGLLLTVLTVSQGFAVDVETYFNVLQGTYLNSSYYSQYEPTPCKALLPHEVCSYLAESITGLPNSFRSNYFGRTDLGYDEDGAGALIALTNGLLIRQFPTGNIQEENDSTKVAQMAFKFKEFFDNFYKIKNVTFEVIVEDGKHIIVAELQKDLFKTTVSHEFNFIEKGSFERVRDLTHIYSSIKSGYINQEDDLISGLEEYNNIINHSTKLSTVQNELDLISTYSAAGVRIEKQRRKPKSISETEQLSGDNTIFLVELIRDESNNLIQRNREGFTDVIGLDGLETAINLGLTPKQILLAHGWEINTGLYKYPNSIVKYNTSDKTTDLQLLKEGETDYIVENQDIVAGTLDNPIFSGFKVLFNSAVSLQTYRTIQDDANSLLAYPAPFGATGLNYLWIDDVSTDAKDKDANIIGIEAFPSDIASRKVLVANGKAVITNENKLIEIS